MERCHCRVTRKRIFEECASCRRKKDAALEASCRIDRIISEAGKSAPFWARGDLLPPKWETFYFRLPDGRIESTSLDINFTPHVEMLRSDVSQYEWGTKKHKIWNSTDSLLRNICVLRWGAYKSREVPRWPYRVSV